MSILNGNELPCMYFVKLQGLLGPCPMSIQPKRGLTNCPKADTAQNQKRSGSCGRSTRVSRESSGIEAELTTGLSRRFMDSISATDERMVKIIFPMGVEVSICSDRLTNSMPWTLKVSSARSRNETFLANLSNFHTTSTSNCR